MSEKRLIQLEAAIKALTKRIEMVEHWMQQLLKSGTFTWTHNPCYGDSATFKPDIGVGEKAWERKRQADVLLDDAEHLIENGLCVENLEGHEVFVEMLEDAKRAVQLARSIL